MATQKEIKQTVDEILERILGGEKVTMETLTAAYPMSPKTLGRYMQRLIDENAHLVEYDIRDKLWRRRTSNRERMPLSDEETFVISAFRELVSHHDSTFKEQAEWFFKKYEDNMLNSVYCHADSEDISDRLPDMVLVQRAIENSSALSINYKGSGERTIYPYRIAMFDGYWYIVARNKTDNKIKKFYFKEMYDLRLSDERYVREDETLNKIENAVNAYFDYDQAPFEVELSVAQEVAHILKRKKINKTQYIMREYDDGTLEISLSVTHPMEIIPFIQSWIPHIHVLSPDSLKAVLRKNIDNFSPD